jgi:hypothetical protein
MIDLSQTEEHREVQQLAREFFALENLPPVPPPPDQGWAWNLPARLA